MAYASEMDANGLVLRTIVIPDDVADEQAYCAKALGHGGIWKRTEQDGSIRKNFAGPGYRYDEAMDAFIPPRPRGMRGEELLSWSVDPKTARWVPPTAYPLDGKDHEWDEATREWKERPTAQEPRTRF